MVGKDPFVLLEGWLRRVLAFDLVLLLLLLLVAGPAARVGIRGAAHGFDATRFAPHRRWRGRDWERTEAATGHSRTAEGDEDEDQLTVISPGQWAVFLCLDVERPKWPNGTACVVQVRKKILLKKR